MTRPAIHPSMARGPPMAAINAGIVMNGPIPIIVDMLRAVAWSSPKRRWSAGGADGCAGGAENMGHF